MNQIEILSQVYLEMQDFFSKDTTGHDWYHIKRVHHNAMTILKTEKTADSFLVQMAALLHDRFDDKLVENPLLEKQIVSDWLIGLGVSQETLSKILRCVDAAGFKGGHNPIKVQTIEEKIVQDADRLDALGAIGVARTFAYSGAKGRPIYLEEGEKIMGPLSSLAAYNKHQGSAIAHFYEKLLLLKDQMNTSEGKRLAEERHQFMLVFWDEFYKEWGENYPDYS